MDTTIVDLPLTLIDEIVSRVDVLSIPCFKATCKTVCNQITTECYNKLVAKNLKKQLSSIINTVEKYHKALTTEDVDDKLLRLLLIKLNNEVHYEERYKERVMAYINIVRLFYIVKKDTNFSIRRIKETWTKYINERPLTEDYIQILESLRKCVIGTKSIYIVSFNYIDKYTKNKSIYCLMNLCFNNNGDVQIGLSLQDVDPYRKIFGTSIEEQMMEILVNDRTLTELSEFIVGTIGTRLCLSEVEIVNNIDKWIGDFTKHSDKIYDSALNILVNPTSYRNEIMNILC
jgi:hypothetical protein